MKLLIQSAMIFFGTLMAAALVALGEPGKADVAIANTATAQLNAQRDARNNQTWIEVVASKARFDVR